ATALAREAAAPSATRLWDESTSNVCVESEAGDAAAAEEAFRRAAHVVRLETRINRVTGVPMEPRSVLAAWDAASGRYTLHAGSGGSWRIRSDVAAALGVPSSAVRVVAGDVGGNYGTRNACYPEFVLAAWAARRLGRPVKWTCHRREAFLTDYQARDLVSHLELGLDRVALRRRNLVPAAAMPYRNPLGLLYDSGDYAAAQDCVVALADWAGFEARRAEARRRGRYRGIGLANYLELNTGMPRERT